MVRWVVAFLVISVSVSAQEDQLCSMAQNINRNDPNTIGICNDTTSCPTGLSCISSICVNYSSVAIRLGEYNVAPPNDIFFSFGLWDNMCNPVVLNRSVLYSQISIYQQRLMDPYFSKQSIPESGNGVIPAFLSNVTSKIAILLDTSGSVIDTWDKTREAAASFVDSLAGRPNGSATILIRIFTFDGRDSILPLRSGSVMVTPTFIDVSTPNLASNIRNSNMSWMSPGYDPSTNLFGALIQVSDILHSASVRGTTMNANYLITYTDGTDRANRVDNFSTVVKALNQDPSVFRYCVVENGELDTAPDTPNKNYTYEMSEVCKHGMYLLSRTDCTRNTLKDKFIEISTILTALISNYGLFLHCASFRKGVFNMQPRFAGSSGPFYSFVADASSFNTSQSVCMPQTAAAWTNAGGNIRINNDLFAQDLCLRKYFSPSVNIHR